MIKLYLSCIVLLSCTNLIAQNAANGEPPKKANKIIVMFDDSANTALDKLTKTLFDKGYIIESKDEKLKLLSTKEKSSKKYATLIKIRASVNDTAIVFTGVIALGFDIEILGARDLQPTYSEISYYGARKSPLRDAWNEMDTIAHLFGDKIVYGK